jgi:sucrose-6F-phosphate phosphohydrolase
MPAELPDGGASRIIVSDIDGTLLDRDRPTAGLETLRLLLAVHRSSTRLVYATGRSFTSTWSLVESGVLPVPDAVVSFVGTELWLPPWERMDPRFASHIASGWNREEVFDVAGLIRDAALQPVRFQTPCKVSFFVTRPSTAGELRRELRTLGVHARVIHSGGRFLDVIPERAGKRGATRYLLERWALDDPLVLACGDSLNDHDVISWEASLGVIVGNAEQGLRRLARDPGVYLATLPHAAGVLEGAEAFGFWPTPGSGTLPVTRQFNCEIGHNRAHLPFTF